MIKFKMCTYCHKTFFSSDYAIKSTSPCKHKKHFNFNNYFANPKKYFMSVSYVMKHLRVRPRPYEYADMEHDKENFILFSSIK